MPACQCTFFAGKFAEVVAEIRNKKLDVNLDEVVEEIRSRSLKARRRDHRTS